MSSVNIHHGDALEILRTLPSDSYHGTLTDPPYGLSFMGHKWDHGVPSAEVWAEVLRCLRPGAHLLAFGGTRTFHRLACAIEDAGFEIRDCMQWIYGSGFPKSLDVSKAIDKANGDWRGKAGAVTSGNAAMGGPNYERTPKGDPIAAAAQWSGHGTALKPAWEPIIVARKPLDGTVAQNVQRWGCGGLAIDACRVGDGGQLQWSTPRDLGYSGGSDSDGVATPNALGRWPANVILDEEAGAMLDAQSGNRPVSGSAMVGKPTKRSVGYGGSNGSAVSACLPNDSGGASRFFYCPKASRSERDAGLEEFEARSRAEATRRKEGSPGSKNAAAGAGGENCRNIHPTVKPIALARYLARLILPPIPDARMLTPFSGSGSEVIGALQAGWSHVDGIDSWDVAVRISRARIAHWSEKLSGPVQLDLTGE
jgi:site-specific DNA-methyltransferase (adenine-specific)